MTADAMPQAPAWPDACTLGEARRWLRQQAMDRGAACPCCAQRAQVYRRAISTSMARDLITLVRTVGAGRPFHLPTELGYGGDAAKLAYWGLLVEDPTPRPDGGRAGWWQVTELGAAYARGTVMLPRHAHVYDGRFLGLSGEPAGIVVALGKRFNLATLLAGEQ